MNKYTNEELIVYLKEKSGGNFLSANDLRNTNSGPSLSAIKRRFGTFNKAKEAAGLKTIPNNEPSNGIDGTEYFNKILEWSSCVNCGESSNACLQFHHFKGEKRFNISTADQPGSTWASSTVHNELQKCLPLCANCHSKHHSKRSDLYLNNIEAPNWPLPQEMAAVNAQERK